MAMRNGWRKLGLISAAIPVVLGVLAPGAMWVDRRYAHSATVQALRQDVLEIRISQALNHRFLLRQRKWELEQVKATGRLTAAETRQWLEIEEDMARTEETLQALKAMREGK